MSRVWRWVMAQRMDQQIQADQAMDAAENDEVFYAGEYTMQDGTRGFRLSLPTLFVDNVPYSPGDVSGCYVDFERGMVVYDFQDGDAYER